MERYPYFIEGDADTIIDRLSLLPKQRKKYRLIVTSHPTTSTENMAVMLGSWVENPLITHLLNGLSSYLQNAKGFYVMMEVCGL